MIIQYLPKLNKKRIILASSSPRRRELLQQLGLQFDIVTSDFEENLPHDRFPSGAEYAIETATHKAIDVAKKVHDTGVLADLVIAADTVVELDGKILEKPTDNEHAIQMLSSLSGRRHQVHTGVVLVLPNTPDPKEGKPPLLLRFSDTTHVEFAALPPDTLRAYVHTGEPMGKAGSYGMQATAGSFVRGIEGCFFNVVGFPVHKFSYKFAQLIQDGIFDL